MKKKFMMMLLSAMMVMGSMSIAHAAEPDEDIADVTVETETTEGKEILSIPDYSHIAEDNSKFNVTINEYEALKELNEELNKGRSLDLNLTDEEMNVIKNYKEMYTNKIEELQLWSTEKLENFNYTQEQIEAIKNFDGSEDMLLRASSKCTVSGDFNSFNPSNRGTTAELIMEFRWNGVQSNWFNDIFAVAWSSPFNATNLDGYVEYKDKDGHYKYIDHNPKAAGLFGSYISFPKYKDERPEPFYVSAGSIIIDLKSNTYISDITGYAEYGYTNFNVSPNVTIDANLGISFNKNVSILDSHRCYR